MLWTTQNIVPSIESIVHTKLCC